MTNNPSRVQLHVAADDVVSPVRPVPVASEGKATASFKLDVVSDVICPWCWVGKRRLAKALNLLGGGSAVQVEWRPFQLNPSMPAEGIDRREYRRRKFGTLEYSDSLDARLVAVGNGEGIDFRFDRIARTPNTLNAHRLIWLSQTMGAQDGVVEALFRAYFTDGVDIGRRENLVTIAASAGVPAADAERILGSDEGVAEVLPEEQHYKAMGIEGVPAFVVAGRVAVSGAAQPEVMAEAFRQCQL